MPGAEGVEEGVAVAVAAAVVEAVFREAEEEEECRVPLGEAGDIRARLEGEAVILGHREVAVVIHVPPVEEISPVHQAVAGRRLDLQVVVDRRLGLRVAGLLGHRDRVEALRDQLNVLPVGVEEGGAFHRLLRKGHPEKIALLRVEALRNCPREIDHRNCRIVQVEEMQDVQVEEMQDVQVEVMRGDLEVVSRIVRVEVNLRARRSSHRGRAVRAGLPIVRVAVQANVRAVAMSETSWELPVA